SQSEFLICLSFATLISGFPLFPELILARILQSGTYSCKLELRFAIEPQGGSEGTRLLNYCFSIIFR
ncbi:MAG: hypothetical protein IJQ42_11200, partial [Oscillospiraceae bacterium]|nr:hypothetical protein [Oscillospiraceae bacterium]